MLSNEQNDEECDPSIPQGKLHRRCHEIQRLVSKTSNL